MTSEQPDSSQQPDCESKTLYLKESLRLSESQIEEQNKTFNAIERKTILLATLCTGVIAFLLSWDIWWDKTNKAMIIFLVIILAILIKAAWIASSVLYTRPFKTTGVNPAYPMWEGFKENFNYNFNKMAMDLLKEYKKRYDFNEVVLEEKINDFNESLCWGKLGIILTCLWGFIILVG